MITEDKNLAYGGCEYKLISFSFMSGVNRREITVDGQSGYVFNNPLVDKTLSDMSKQGWRPVSISNSGHGTLFIMLMR